MYKKLEKFGIFLKKLRFLKSHHRKKIWGIHYQVIVSTKGTTIAHFHPLRKWMHKENIYEWIRITANQNDLYISHVYDSGTNLKYQPIWRIENNNDTVRQLFFYYSVTHGLLDVFWIPTPSSDSSNWCAFLRTPTPEHQLSI